MNAKSFPPASDLLAILRQVDWAMVGNIAVEGIDYFLHIVEVCVAYVAAFCQASIIMWQRHSMTDKIIKMAKVAYTWMIQVAIPQAIISWAWMQQVGYPKVRQSALKAYTFTKATCETVSDIYSLVTARQFTTL